MSPGMVSVLLKGGTGGVKVFAVSDSLRSSGGWWTERSREGVGEPRAVEQRSGHLSVLHVGLS